MRLTLGEMLYRFRIEREIEAKQICKGLCSTSAMSFFEQGERVPDSLLVECLVERMGVSPEEFSLMVSYEEYEYYEWKGQVYDMIENGEWEKLGLLLQSGVTKKVYCNSKLEKQFFSYASGVYCASQGNYKEATQLLKTAKEQTIPNISVLQEENVLLGTMELSILMLYLYYGVKGQVLDDKEGIILFQILEDYIYNGNLDINERGKCYPKLVCIGLHCFSKQLEDVEQIRLCEKAIQILRTHKTFYDITETLRLYISLLEKFGSDQLGFYKKQYEVFCDLLQSENIDISFRPEVRGVRKPKIFMIHEYLSSKRKEKGFTQERLSEGIYEPESYSRVEKGKRAPTRKKFQELANRLDIDWCNYRGELDTCELKAYQLRRKQRIANIEGRYQDSISILLKLEKCLDMSNIINYQYVKSSEWVAKFRMGLLKADETYDKLEKLLKLNQRRDLDTSYLVYYSQTELEIIGHMAQLLGEQKKYREGIQIIEKIIKQMMHSKVSLEYQWNGVGFLLRILCGLYFEIGKYETTIKIAKYVRTVMIKQREGANLYITLDEIADALEHIGEHYSEEYKKLYRYTYYLADFFTTGKVKTFAKKYYEDRFDAMIVWYES